MKKQYGYQGLFVVLMIFFTQPLIADPEFILPEQDSQKHLGVASCSTNVCHGKIKPSKEGNIWLNEYRLWSTKDYHSRAYQTLTTKASKRIAKNLGLKNAHTAKICLDCHADNVEKSRRGPKFQISDGVSCEACHGGSELWIKSHTEKTATHEQNLAKGLYPTENGFARAKLCLSCHYGTKNKLATHQIMGAGHPRLSFELETFTANQPAHYDIDEDYITRKGVFSGFNMWVVGQLESVNTSLALMDSHLLRENVLIPELFFYDCHACHHPMSDMRWKPSKLKGRIAPGVIRLNDANLLMLIALVEVITPEKVKLLKQHVAQLHQASLKDKESLKKAIKTLSVYMTILNKEFANHNYALKEIKKMRKTLLKKSAKGDYRDYAAAEQAFLAVEGITIALSQDKLNKPLNQWYETLKDEDRFSPERYRAVAAKIQKAFD